MCFLGIASTKIGSRAVTYAQIFCCGAVRERLQADNRYQTDSEPKLLIHIAFLNCFFYGQSSKSLDLQGLQLYGGNLSTKLSTEKSNVCKAFLNQALSAFFRCIRQPVLRIPRTFLPAT